jgi:hypothetical protein
MLRGVILHTRGGPEERATRSLDAIPAIGFNQLIYNPLNFAVPALEMANQCSSRWRFRAMSGKPLTLTRAREGCRDLDLFEVREFIQLVFDHIKFFVCLQNQQSEDASVGCQGTMDITNKTESTE